MDAERWQRMRELYERAVELAPEEREPFLERACGDDDDLRVQLRGMLASADAAGEGAADSGDGFLEPPPAPVAASIAPALAPGTRIGSFVLGQPIASGGMGTVYAAKQEEPRRRVALKLLHSGATSKSAVRRFRFEAELLARLEHPGIATIYEAGVHVAENGGQTPYLAMEFVEDARDLVTWARERDLTLDARIELFTEVCAAVQHGHQQGVVHRDLKPPNLLVDGTGRVRVIDFGIARAMGRENALGDLAAPATQLTAAGEILGTLAYMSPEQFGADSRAIDTRSDVYSLGVVLHELLCGRPPFELADRSLLELSRIVVDEEPAPPAELPRDLGWILCKALAKRPEQRYASASELAADLRRFVDDEPVEAGAPSATYRWSKFVRRNRAAVAMGALALVGVVGGSIAAMFGLFEARAASDAFAAERDVAVAEASKFASMSEVLIGMLLSVSPEQDGREARVADVLDRASVELAAIDDPAVAGPVRYVMGRSYDNLGLRESATEELRQAVELATSAEVIDPEFAARTRYDLARVLTASGHADEAHALLTQAIGEALAALGATAPALLTLRAGEIDALLRLGEIDRALAIARAETPVAEELLGPEAPETLALCAQLGWALRAAGEHEQALEVMSETLRRTELVRGAASPATLQARYERAKVLRKVGRAEEGLAELEALLPLYEEAWGEGSARTCRLQADLAELSMLAGRLDAAYALLLTAVPCLESTLDPGNPALLVARGNLATLLDRMGDDASALAVRRSAWERAAQYFGPDDDRTLSHAHNLAIQLQKLRQPAEGIELEERVTELWRERYGLDDERTLEALEIRAKLYLDVGRLEEALPIQREVLDARTRRNGPDSPITLRVHTELTSCLAYLGRLEEALAEGERVYAIHRRAVAESDPSRVIVVSNLAGYARELGLEQLNVEYSREAWRLCTEHGTLDSTNTGMTGMLLGEALLLNDEPQEAVEPLRAAIAAFLESPGSVPHYRGRTHGALGSALDGSGQPDEAIAEYERALEFFVQLGDETTIAKLEGRIVALEDAALETEDGR